jgi:ribonuclease HI
MSNQKRKIIYTDASIPENGKAKIGLYDPDKNATHTLELKEDILNSLVAERYGVLYAIIYAVKLNYSNVMILTDNKQILEDNEIFRLANFTKIAISWIPREINLVADTMSKMKPTLKEKEWYILDLFYKLHITNRESEPQEVKIEIPKPIIAEVEKKQIPNPETNKRIIGNREISILEKVIIRVQGSNGWSELGMIGKELNNLGFQYKLYSTTLGKMFEQIKQFELSTINSIKLVRIKK